MVLVRQRPGSAKGVVFMTLEDETGIANIVVWPKVMEQYRKEVMGARLILVEGYIQSSPEQVTHLVAQRMFDRSHDLIGLANDAPSRKHPVPAGPALIEPLNDDRRDHADSPRRKSATRATSASCRRHGIFIELDLGRETRKFRGRQPSALKRLTDSNRTSRHVRKKKKKKKAPLQMIQELICFGKDVGRDDVLSRRNRPCCARMPFRWRLALQCAFQAELSLLNWNLMGRARASPYIQYQVSATDAANTELAVQTARPPHEA